jgi:hypothetical protein
LNYRKIQRRERANDLKQDYHQFRGYYSALLVREADGVKIFEETVNVAAP